MGRPRLDDHDKRLVQVNIRLTEDEYKKVSQYAEASHLTPANWIRYKVFNGKFPPMKTSPIDAKVFYELIKWGSTLIRSRIKLIRVKSLKNICSLRFK